jgi:hypothetical protein
VMASSPACELRYVVARILIEAPWSTTLNTGL